MSSSYIKTYALSRPEIANYVGEVLNPEDSALRRARERMEESDLPSIQIGAFDARHLEILARSCQAKRAVEIGTLGGYSAIALARGLSEGGKLYSLELEKVYAELARESIRLAGFQDRVEVVEGPALDSLAQLAKNGPFDLVFIDADKVNYPHYLEWSSKHLRPGGLCIADNTFAWGGIDRMTFTTGPEKDAVFAIREFNDKIANGGGFVATILPTGEGLTVGVKR